MMRPSIALVFAASVLIAAPVRAQATAEQRAAADALYEEAGTLMKASHFAEACPKLETSQRLDPGLGTLLRLGYCYEHVGKTASAWSAYNEAEGMARRAGDKRADDAAARAKALEPKLVKLLLTVQSPAAGLEIRRGGKPVDPGLWGTAIPVDPGELVVEASAPGKKPWKGTARIDATPGATTTFSIPALADAEGGAAASAPRPFWNGQRIAGTAVAGVGLVGLVVGAVTGVKALNDNAASKTHCRENTDICTADGVSLRHDSVTEAHISTASFAVGGAALVTGAVLFFTASGKSSQDKTGRRVDVQPVVGPSIGGLSFRGVW